MSSSASWSKAVVFDMDGTLFISPFDWRRIKAELGVKEGLILDHLRSLPDEERRRKFELLEALERETVFKGKPAPGAKRILSRLRRWGWKLGILTNNSRPLTSWVLSRLGFRFDAVVTRDDGVWKPYPESVEKVLSLLEVSPERTVYVGDNALDIKTALPFPFPLVIIVNSDPALRAKFRGRVKFVDSLEGILKPISQIKW